MNDLLNVSAESLRRAAEIREQMESLQNELFAILSGDAPKKRMGRPPGSGKAKTMGKGRRKMSAAGRAKIAAAARARWAKAKASGKNSL